MKLWPVSGSTGIRTTDDAVFSPDARKYFRINLTCKMSSCILCIMENKTYTISDLEKLTGLNRRTIHFYTKERLILPPEGAGGGARYREEHLLRLMLIGEMQKSRLKLDEIRDALNGMSIEEMRSLLDRAGASNPHVRDKESLESWLKAEKIMSNHSVSLSSDSAVMDVDDIKPMSFLKMGRGHQVTTQRSSERFLQNLRRSQPVREESWQRFEVAEGLELNVRSDIARRHRQLLVHLLEELARKIREEG